jgi:hypothetical protein
LKVILDGIRTDGEMAKEVDFSKQRPAEFVFSRHVEEALAKIHADPDLQTGKVPARTEEMPI